MKCAGIRRFVEIEIAAEHFVSPFSAEDHLDSHTLDVPCQKEHGRRGADGSDIVGFRIVNHVAQRIESFLDGVIYLVVHRPYVVGHLLCLNQVGRAAQTYGERVQTGPPGGRKPVGLDAARRIFLRDGRDYRAVEAAGEEHAVGHVAHKLAPDGAFERIAQLFRRGGVVFHSLVVEPVAHVPALHAALGAEVAVAGEERLVAVAKSLEGFQLAGHVDFAVGVAADVEGHYAYRVAGYEEAVFRAVV